MGYDKAVIAWQRKNYSIETLENGFTKSGIYPFCDTVIPSEKYDIAARKKFQKARKVDRCKRRKSRSQ